MSTSAEVRSPTSDAVHEFWHAAGDGHSSDHPLQLRHRDGRAGVIDAVVKVSTWACRSGDSESSAEKLLKHGG